MQQDFQKYIYKQRLRFFNLVASDGLYLISLFFTRLLSTSWVFSSFTTHSEQTLQITENRDIVLITLVYSLCELWGWYCIYISLLSKWLVLWLQRVLSVSCISPPLRFTSILRSWIGRYTNGLSRFPGSKKENLKFSKFPISFFIPWILTLK